MKRCMTIFTLFSLSLTIVLGEESHLDIRYPARESSKLLGPVQSITTETNYNMSDEHLKVLTAYDRVGNLVNETEWDVEGELANTATNFYNDAGCYVRLIYTEFGEDGYTSKWEVILSPDTRQIGMKNKSNGDTVVRTYSPERRLLSYRLTDRRKKLKRASKNKWNAEFTHRTQFVSYDENNRPLYTYYFKWKDNGFVDMKRQRQHQDKKEFLEDYEYLAVDGHGNWSQQIMVRYDITGGGKEKVYERTTTRTIKYYETESSENVP
jgi:hypothetical protein